MRRLIAVLLTGLCALGISGGPEATAQQTFAVVDPPACISNTGEPVAFEAVEGRSGLAAGMARRDGEGRRVVLRSSFSAAPPAFQQFIDRHECAHHQTGDVDMPHPPRNGPEHLMNEAVADCIAVLRLRDEEGYDKARLAEVTAALAADMARIGFPDISVSSRIRNIEGCYGRDGDAAQLIAARLEERGLK